MLVLHPNSSFLHYGVLSDIYYYWTRKVNNIFIAKEIGMVGMEEEIKEIKEEMAGLITENKAREILQEKNGTKSINAKIVRAFEPKHFEKKGRKGKVQRILISIEGKPPETLVLWNDLVDKAVGANEGDELILSGFYMKDGEFHIARNGLVQLKKREAQGAMEAKAGSLPAQGSVSLNGKIKSKGDVREFEREKRKFFVLNLILEDETGTAQIVIWDKEIAHSLKEGDKIKVINGYMKNNEVHVGRMGSVEVELK